MYDPDQPTSPFVDEVQASVKQPSAALTGMVDHFRIIRAIGHGGMGEVYLARDTQLGRRVALKVLHPERLGADAVQRFLEEARMTARFSHPNIVAIYGFGEVDGRPYVALEYLDGQTLQDRIKEQRPSAPEIIRIGLAIAEALAEAHRNDILHRDLKPANVLLPKDGRLRVVDFGLAQPVEREEELVEDRTSDGNDPEATTRAAGPERRVNGTPAYMSPEQWYADPLGGSTDVWAMGVILHEMVTGFRPYQHIEHNFTALAKQVTHSAEIGRPPAPPTTPPELVELIRDCLRKRPDERPSTQDVVDRLEQLTLTPTVKLKVGESPFRGLKAFQPRHADYFHGRDAEVAAALENLREDGVMPVVGASGAGKSSFVQAGLIPRLRERGKWRVLSMRPGYRPFFGLASRLLSGTADTSINPDVTAPVAQNAQSIDSLAGQLADSPWTLSLILNKLAREEDCQILLFVDQLEELFTLIKDVGIQRSFLQAICHAADEISDPVRVVFTIRHDFFGLLARGGPEVRHALGRITILQAPDKAALKDILTLPVEVVGYRYDDTSVVKDMIKEVEGEANILPLVQFAARQMWEQRDESRRLLLRSTYKQMGGVTGALAHHADALLEGLTANERNFARMMLLRLVTPKRTRKSVSRRELLEGFEPEAAAVLDRLVDGRIVTAKRSQDASGALELTHESLITTWKSLARWLDDANDDLRLLNEVQQAAETWVANDRRADLLWHGDALIDAIRWRDRTPFEQIPAAVVGFIDSAETKKRNQRLRRTGLVLTVILALAGIAAIFAFQKRVADRERDRAQRATEYALVQQAAALREGAASALDRGDVLEARARLRRVFEVNDSGQARALWRRLAAEPMLWSHPLSDPVTGLVVSPDGSAVAATTGGTAVEFFDTQTRALRVIRTGDSPVRAIELTKNGTRLLTGHEDGHLRLWDLASKDKLRDLKAHDAPITTIAFDAYSTKTFSADEKGKLYAWAAEGTEPISTLSEGPSEITRVRVSPDGEHLAATSEDGELRIWSLETYALTSRVRAHGDRVNDLAFSPAGKLMATASRDRSIALWRFPKLSPLGRLYAQTGAVWALAFGPNGQHLLSAGSDATIRRWDVTSGKVVDAFAGHRAPVRALAYTLNGKFFASGSNDRTLRFWSAGQHAYVDRRDEAHKQSVLTVAFSRDGKSLVSAGLDETVRFWETTSGRALRAIRKFKGTIGGVALSPDGRTLAVARQHVIRLWDLETGLPQSGLLRTPNLVTGVRFLPDSKHIVTIHNDGDARMWSVKKREQVRVLEGNGAWLTSMALDDTGEYLVTGATDGHVRVWDLESTKSKVVTKHKTSVNTVAADADGNIVSGDTAGAVLYVRPKKRKVRVLSSKGAAVTSVAIDEGGRVFAARSDGTIVRWKKGGKMKAFLTLNSGTTWLEYSSEAKALAVATADGSIRLFDPTTARPRWFAPLANQKLARFVTHQGWASTNGTRVREVIGARWAEAIERSRSAALSSGGDLACVAAWSGHVDMWTKQDTRTAHVRFPDVTAVRSLGQTCLAFSPKKVMIVSGGGATQTLVEAPTIDVTTTEDTIAVLGRGVVELFNADGTRRTKVGTELGATAVAVLKDSLLIGYSDGNVSQVTLAEPRKVVELRLDRVPSSPVTRIQMGPRKTVFVGYLNGVVGSWDVETGARLDVAHIHGSIEHLLLNDEKLLAVSDLGRYLIWDLGVFSRPYCELSKDLANKVPVSWENGRPTVRAMRTPPGCKPVSSAQVSGQ